VGEDSAWTAEAVPSLPLIFALPAPVLVAPQAPNSMGKASSVTTIFCVVIIVVLHRARAAVVVANRTNSTSRSALFRGKMGGELPEPFWRPSGSQPKAVPFPGPTT
jgi:hypothetical protein